MNIDCDKLLKEIDEKLSEKYADLKEYEKEMESSDYEESCDAMMDNEYCQGFIEGLLFVMLYIKDEMNK